MKSLILILLLFICAITIETPSQAPKSVFAYYIVANSEHQDLKTLQNHIQLAISAGIDGFALSITKSSLMPSLISSIFESALAFPDFKLYFSFDMTQIFDLTTPIELIKQYYTHPNYFKFQGKYFVSTFGGEMLKFGEKTTNEGWEKNFKKPLKEANIEIFFVPSWSVFDTVESTKHDIYSNNVFTRNSVLDGGLNWGGAWSTRNDYKTNEEDEGFYKSIANDNGNIYMATVSPWFFTHSSRKNWIYKSEKLYPTRWQEIVEIQPDLVLIDSWNNYEESNYIGPLPEISGLPFDSWVKGFDHTAWLDVTSYYIKAYKQRKSPVLIQDQVTFWFRTHSKNDRCRDKVGLPINADWTEDKIIIHAVLAFVGQVIVMNGDRTKVFNGKTGINVFEMPFQEGSVVVSLFRNKKLLARKEGTKWIQEGIQVYNFNAYVDKLVYRMNNAGNFRRNIFM